MKNYQAFFVIPAAVVSSVISFEASASFGSSALIPRTNYCSQIHSGVKQIIVDYDADIPNVKDLDSTIKAETKSAERILSEGGIPIGISKHEHVDQKILPENSMLIKMVYSFVDKKAFTIQPENSQIASWIEIYRNLHQDDGTIKLVVKRTNIQYSEFSDGDLPRGLLVSSRGLIQNLSCDVLQNSVNMFCSNRRDFTENKIKTISNPCSNELPIYDLPKPN